MAATVRMHTPGAPLAVQPLLQQYVTTFWQWTYELLEESANTVRLRCDDPFTASVTITLRALSDGMTEVTFACDDEAICNEYWKEYIRWPKRAK